MINFFGYFKVCNCKEKTAFAAFLQLFGKIG